MSCFVNALPRNRKLFLWPAAAITITALVSANPFYEPEISLCFGVAAWFADLALALICWVHPITARAGALLAGVFMAVPCFLDAPPLFRGGLMCGMFIPLVLASIPVLAPSVTGFRARLALLCSFDHTRDLKRRPRYFDTGSLVKLFLAIIVFGTALDAVESVPALGLWYLARWLAGGIMILAFAEMWTAFQKFLTASLGLTAPLLMQSPVLSTSITEFWTKRWNPGTSFMFRRLCFEPLTRRSPMLAFSVAFGLSGAGHMLLFYMATLNWEIAIINGSFFFVQPICILAERHLNVRRWAPAAGRVWTLAVLAITSPLFVEPAIEIIQSVPRPNSVLAATFIVLGIVIFGETLFLLAALVSSSGSDARRTEGPTPFERQSDGTGLPR
jgi:hypothetical protein